MLQQKEPYRVECTFKYLSPPPRNKKRSHGRGSPKPLPDLTFYNFITWQGYQNHVQNNAQASVVEHKMGLSTSFSRDILFFLKIYNALISVEMPSTTILNITSSNNIYLNKCEYVKATYRTTFF